MSHGRPNAASTPQGKLTGEKPPGNPEGSLDKCSEHIIYGTTALTGANQRARKGGIEAREDDDPVHHRRSTSRTLVSTLTLPKNVQACEGCCEFPAPYLGQG